MGLFGNFFCYNTTVITCTSATSATVINYALLFNIQVPDAVSFNGF